MTETYYIIETAYVGPNPNDDRYTDADYYDITTVPGRTNMSNEVRTNGWLGTTNDWSYYARGEYDSLEDAQDALETMLWPYRDVTETVETWDRETYGVVLRAKPGAYERWGPQATQEWVYEGVKADITANTTDAAIEALVEEYVTAGRQEAQAELDAGAIAALMESQRDTCRDRAAE